MPGRLAKFDGSVSLMAWAYNEEESIALFLDKAFALMDTLCDDWEVIVVNDGSTDRTLEILQVAADEKPGRLRIINHPSNLNVGWAVRTAFQTPAKQYAFFQTVDWSYDLTHARVFLELLRHYDVVKGARITQSGSLARHVIGGNRQFRGRSDTVGKAVISLANYYILRVLYGIPFADFQNIFFTRSDILKDVQLESTTALANPEALIRLHAKGYGILEVPISFAPREKGQAKGTRPITVIRSLVDVISNWVNWGWALRGATDNKIHSLIEPFELEEDVLALCIPLFKECRRRIR